MKATYLRIPILAYHSILPNGDDLLTLQPTRFKEQMGWLADNGFSVISLQDAVAMIKAGKKIGRSVVLTFDDGYANFLEFAVPILEAYDFPAVVFLVTGKLGKESDWNKLSKPRRLLDLSEVMSLHGQGYHFGSHTTNHIDLTHAHFSQVQFELSNSFSFLRNTIGETFFTLSYPYGSAGRREFNAASKIGYDCACVTNASKLQDLEPVFCLPRIEIHPNLGIAQFGAIIQNRSNLKLTLDSFKTKTFARILSIRKSKAHFPPSKTINIDPWIGPAVSGIDAWLDSMHSPNGFAGPVSHWWQSSLFYTGPALDWRYEGIILGYLTLFKKTGEEIWLNKAIRAGNDLVEGQFENGNYRASGFELNPCSQGTPHEAACDLALLELASKVKSLGRPDWNKYFLAAEKNLDSFILNTLWDEKKKYFRDTPQDDRFTPNKAATIVEALWAYKNIKLKANGVAEYIESTLEKIVECQVNAPGENLDGAIDQSCLDGNGSGRYFPFYNARCIPALLLGYQATGNEHYARSARATMGFILRHRLPNGSFPAVVYLNGNINQYPHWVAGVGDILRAMDLLQTHGMDLDPTSTLEWLILGQLPSGGVRTAEGFSSIATQHKPQGDDFRDLLPVCGWVDKAFRYLASIVPQGWSPTPFNREIVELDCLYQGQQAVYRETDKEIKVAQGKKIRYAWHKGEPWAQVS